MQKPALQKSVDIVVITSKLCNMRCRYCYELPLLSDKTRITAEQMTRAFENVHAFFRGVDDRTTIRFCWHGGEPLLIEPDYYWNAFEQQKRIFAGSKHEVVNHVQTNLTLLDDSRLDLLHNGFDDVGVSLDLVGGLRVNVAGKDLEPRTRENLDRVLETGLRPGGITVLSRANMDHIKDIYAFYKARDMSFRVLPLEPGLYDPGQSFEITPREIVRTLCSLADLWFTDAPEIRIEPIHAVMGALLGAASGDDSFVLPTYDLSAWQWVILLDTNGQVMVYGDDFGGDDSAGNLFEQGLDEILASPRQRQRAAAASEAIATSCARCPYFNTRCNGHWVAEGGATMHEIDDAGTRRCVVARGLFEHVERRLVQAGVLDAAGALSARYLEEAAG